MNVHVFRLLPGQDLRKEIELIATSQKITAGWICTCVGSLTRLNLRFAHQNIGSVSEGYFEIVSLVGTVSINGCHLHISVSDDKGVTVGGHLLYDNIVNTTAEIVLGEIAGLSFSREKDDRTGWAELQINRKSDEGIA